MLPTLVLLFSLTAGPPVTPVNTGSAATTEVDVELVLAVDMSGSMDIEEARIQRAGYIEAIRHPDFANAVSAGLIGRIAISYFEWAGSVNETSLVDWQVIETAADAAAFAEKLEARPVSTRRGTSISNAISYGAALIEANAFAGLRRVIDVSGDGPNNMGPPVTPARDRAVANGLVVNGLAILIRPSGARGSLDRYYADCVIGGPGSFVLPVHQPADFATAIRQKLVMEISNLETAPRLVPIQIAPPTDCMIGEKLRPMFLDRN